MGFSCCFAPDSRNAVLAHGPSARNGDLRDLRGSLELPFWQWVLESMERSPPARYPLFLLRVKARLKTVHCWARKAKELGASSATVARTCIFSTQLQ